MRIFDFHNDRLTADDTIIPVKDYGGAKIIKVIFRGNRSFEQAVSLAENEKRIAFEDFGYEYYDLDIIKRLNPYYIGLTWNGENNLGYGCNYNFGLKPNGLNLVKKLGNIPVDTAHISKFGFKQIIDNAERVVNSHTAFSGAFRCKRNLEDWQIKLIIEKKGIIGICLVGYFLSEMPFCSIADVIRHMVYFADRFGTDNLAVGTDFNGTDFLPEGLNSYNKLQAVKKKMAEVGFTDREIENIFYDNLNKFYGEQNGRYKHL